VSCAAPVISETGQATLQSYSGRTTNTSSLEASGSHCSVPTGLCQSTGTYTNVVTTLPGFPHYVNWHYVLKLASGYWWTDTGSGSACSGYGSRTLTCDVRVLIQVPYS
jgi:hypothetical protein